MSWFRKWLYRLGGYSPTEVEGSQDIGRILRIGMGVSIAANFAGLNWAVAGWTYSGDIDSSVKYLVAASRAILGVTLVCVFDPSFIYFLDTKRPGMWGSIKASGYAVIRVGLILMISSVTSQAIIPFLLRNELAGHALKVREAHEKTRNADLTVQYNMIGKQSVLEAASSEIEQWKKAVETLPQPIQSHLANAENCWQQYKAKKVALIRQGLARRKASAQLQGEAQRCSYQMQTARKERDDYFASAQDQLNAAIQKKNKALTEFDQTKSMIERKSAEASAKEEASYTPTSAVVLADLLTQEPAAKYKWAMITGILMATELLFLLLKFQAGQTVIGQQIAASRLKQERAIEQSIKQSEDDHAIWQMLNAASLGAAEAGIASPKVIQAFERMLTDYLQTLVPLECSRATISTMVLNATEVERHQREYPQLAGLIGQIWTSAIRRAVEILVTPDTSGGTFEWTPSQGEA